ncbi:MAG TPA: bifunctional (p)ppGpp synthetase/guanosine-3',5'-bis(diphosphate) 3'-pyrophosphohydrolase, partial [Aquifex sp.]|nr:bifunctional (p)ppGpp synthetase/guanosine-3',5'-bis(diphosphate) 3'-pyrophosphohydrolase [Aquifex sp.]
MSSIYPPLEELERELLRETDNNPAVRRAIEYAKEKHKEQRRKTGEPYVVHPLWVALKLAQMKMDIPTVVAGVLHDTVEDTDATLEEIEGLFGREVARLVDGVTKLDKHRFRSKDEAQAENFRKLLLATAEDIRTLIIKLVDRLDNMRSLSIFRREKQQRIARETLLVYAPLAHLLGMWEIKSQLEDLSFKYLYPEEYERVKHFVGKARRELEEYLKKYVIPPLKEELERAGIPATIKYRSKHLYSIWEKTKRKGIDLEEVHDILGVRIITDTVPQCYTALGVVHQLWKPVAGKFKDYISMPKPNLYQSLHTTVVGPKGRWVEFQIRTWDMHYIAEKGIAAHWAYKAGRKPKPQEEKIAKALRDLVESFSNPEEYREITKRLREELDKEVFVYTPKGDVVALPKGATPVDFAYAIHTELGNRCAGAKVDGRIVPLDYKLQTGERVEIITHPNKKPSPEWLKFVKTAKARQRIKQFLKKELEERLLEEGRKIWLRLAEKYNLDLKEVLERTRKTERELFIQLAKGKLSEKWILSHLPKEKKEGEHIPDKAPQEGVLDWEEFRGIKYTLAKCCHPLPGEEVKAVIQRGKGLVLHSKDCPNLKNLERIAPHKVFTVRWNEKGQFPVPLQVVAYDYVGLLSDITSLFAQKGVNIVNANTSTRGDKAYLNITGIFKDYNHLKEV